MPHLDSSAALARTPPFCHQGWFRTFDANAGLTVKLVKHRKKKEEPASDQTVLGAVFKRNR